MRILLLSLLVSLLFASADASLYRAGSLSYTQISNFTYKFNLLTYTHGGSSVDRDSLFIKWGHGNLGEMIPRDSIVIMTNDVKINRYRFSHTFPGPGTYVVSMEDCCRIDGIKNMPNSVSTPFYLEAVVIITNPAVVNNSPILLQPPIDLANKDEPYVHFPNAYDKDGDSLRFTLVPCKGSGGIDISGYRFPGEFGGNGPMEIDALTGELTWENPVLPGEYNIAIHVSEFRFGVLMGSTLTDMQIEVKDDGPSPFVTELGSQISVRIKPNPFSDQTVISVSTSSEADLRLGLFSILGKQFSLLQSKDGQFTINRKDLPSGIYLFKITDGQQFVGGGKLVVN